MKNLTGKLVGILDGNSADGTEKSFLSYVAKVQVNNKKNQFILHQNLKLLVYWKRLDFIYCMTNNVTS